MRFTWDFTVFSETNRRSLIVLLFSVAFLTTNIAQLAGTLVGWANAETLRQGDLALTAIDYGAKWGAEVFEALIPRLVHQVD